MTRAGRGQPGTYFRRVVFFRGTFFPAARASDKPMAIACLRLVTFLPDRPLRRVPAFLSCIAFSTFAPAALLYFVAMITPDVLLIEPMVC